MTFTESILACLLRHAQFSGRGSRSEFWRWILFTAAAPMPLALLNETAAWVFNVAVLLPSLAVGARRLHDIGRSGWWQLLLLTPGLVVVVWWWASRPSQPSAATL